MRGVSTVLDVALCLLLVSASALVLAGTPVTDRPSRQHGVDPDSADEIADLLATSTARVNYSAGDRDRTARDRTTHDRTAHDTLAGLLASAVRADASNDAPATASTFTRAVTDRVTRELARTGIDAQVVARSPATRADRDPPDTRLVAGRAPPPNVDVHAAALVVDDVAITVRTWSA